MGDLLLPDTVDAAETNSAQTPSIGSDFNILVSTRETWELATIDITAADTGTLTVNAGIAAALSAEPRNLIVAVKSDRGIKTDQAISLTLTGTDQDSTALSAVPAVMSYPAWSGNTSKDYFAGYGACGVPGTAGKLFKTLASMTIDCTASAVGGQLVILAVPKLSDFSAVGCAKGVNFKPKTPDSIAIACGSDGSAFVRSGRSQPGELTLRAAYFNELTGLNRFAGMRVSVLIKLVKEGTWTASYLFSGYTVKPMPTVGEGNDEATTESTAFYEKMITIAARDA